MSYGYTPLDGNALHAMVPLMGNISNITNGSNFLPQLAAVASAGGNISNLSAQSLIPAHIPAALNDSPLEFKTKTTATNSKANVDNGVKSASLTMTPQNQLGAGPMDIENDNDSPTSLSINPEPYSTTKRQTMREQILRSGSLDNEICNSGLKTISESTVLSTQTTTSAVNKSIVVGNEMFLNGMMGVGPPPPPPHSHHQHPHHPQGFMMMPAGMMMDPSAMAAATIQMQQYPLMAAAIPSQQPAAQSAVGTQQMIDPNQTQSSASLPVLPVQMKEIITCKSCTLYPPNPNAPPPTIRERPPGCRTVFVGGLPENISEEIIREVFESCGEITTLRLSKKNFCHIRFAFEASVDSAIYLSGYRIRIANSSESANCGRLHVDYAQARDDQYEWECKQRQLQREQRHRERMERDRLRSMSPPPIVHYTEHEAGNVAEKLKNDDSFLKAVVTLIAWLERGDCSKKNANTFYSMLQSTNAHVRRLQNDKQQYEEELKRAREQFRKQMQSMAQQFIQIEKVFIAASHKKVWDHFTKAQRKNIDLWKKQSTDTRCVQIEDDDMEMSDDERDSKTRSKRTKYDNESLKEENDSLRCQLEAYRNEMNLVKSDLKSDTDFREQQIKVLQETIRNLQTQLIENKLKEKESSTKISELETKLKQANVKELLLKTKIVEVNARNQMNKSSENEDSTLPEKNQSDNVMNHHEDDSGVTTTTTTTVKSSTDVGNSKTSINSPQIKVEKIERDDARIIGLVSTFLVVHPFGASSDYICSYLQKLHPDLRPRELEEILSKYNSIFCEEVTGIGAKIERKWKFCGFTDFDHGANTDSCK